MNGLLSRQLALFYAYRLFATSYLWVPILVKFRIARGLDFSQVMILGAIYSAVVIVMELPTGAFADRIGRRSSMAIGAGCMTVSCLIAFSSHSFEVFLLAEVFAAVSMSMCSGADSAYLYDLLSAHDRKADYPKHEAIASSFHQVGSAAAFAGGGFLAWNNLAAPYLVTALTATIALALALLMKDEKAFPKRRKRTTSIAEIGRHQRTAVGLVFSSKHLRWTIVYSALVFLLLRASEYLYQPYLESRGFEIWQVGLVFAGVYVTAAVVARLTPTLRRHLGEGRLLALLLAILACTYLALEFAHGAWALGVLLLQAFANGLYSPLVKPIINRYVEESDYRASVLSAESIARRFGIVVFWPIAGSYGAGTATTACGVVGVAGALLLAVVWSITIKSDTPTKAVSRATK